MPTGPLHIARLGTVEYRDAVALQEAAHARRGESWLLMLEHPHVYTLGVRANPEHVLVDPATVGATLVRATRGGDVTYHGPGQLVGYPIVDVALRTRAIPDHVHSVEQVVIDALAQCGVDGAQRRDGCPGVWLGDEKVAAIGVRITRGRSMHGFAINVDPDLTMFEHIVPCGIRELGVTSMAAAGASVTLAEVVEVVARRAADQWGDGELVDEPRAIGAAYAARPTGTFEKPATFDIWTRRNPVSSTS
ncbi:MAG: lipoyl(octanoyl) transferase LipB [Acidimicrobiia bacterium]